MFVHCKVYFCALLYSTHACIGSTALLYCTVLLTHATSAGRVFMYFQASRTLQNVWRARLGHTSAQAFVRVHARLCTSSVHPGDVWRWVPGKPGNMGKPVLPEQTSPVCSVTVSSAAGVPLCRGDMVGCTVSGVAGAPQEAQAAHW